MDRFRDRHDAGRHLAAALIAEGFDASAIVLALPRGGVPVAAEVADALDADLDVLVVRKLGAPEAPEVALGAIGEGGVEVLDERMLSIAGGSRRDLDETIRRERAELDRRLAAYRGGRAAAAVQGRTVVIVDDGVATGSTAQAAIEVVRARGAKRVVLAVPVAGPAALDRLEVIADRVVAVRVPDGFRAVGEWYRDFSQTSDEEVIEVLTSRA